MTGCTKKLPRLLGAASYCIDVTRFFSSDRATSRLWEMNGSNPSPSSVESDANLTFCGCEDARHQDNRRARV